MSLKHPWISPWGNVFLGFTISKHANQPSPAQPSPWCRTRETAYWLVVRQPLRDVQTVDLGGNLLPVPRLGDSDGRQVLQQTEQPALPQAAKSASYGSVTRRESWTLTDSCSLSKPSGGGVRERETIGGWGGRGAATSFISVLNESGRWNGCVFSNRLGGEEDSHPPPAKMVSFSHRLFAVLKKKPHTPISQFIPMGSEQNMCEGAVSL